MQQILLNQIAHDLSTPPRLHGAGTSMSAPQHPTPGGATKPPVPKPAAPHAKARKPRHDKAPAPHAGPTLQDCDAAIGAELASGGEGRIHVLRDDPSRLAKIYNPRCTPDIAKLSSMISPAYADLKARERLAWPERLVHDKAGNPVGFIMKRVQGIDLHNFNPARLSSAFPGASRTLLAHTALNTAAMVHNLHRLDITIGDLQPRNILASTAGKVGIIDCDSFQPPGFSSKGHIAEFSAPEFLRGTVPVRDQRCDAFALAILIFRILHIGIHPYQNLKNVPIEQQNTLGIFAFQTGNRRLLPKTPLYGPIWDLHPEPLRKAFTQVFTLGQADRGARLSAWEWVSILEPYYKDLRAGREDDRIVVPKPPRKRRANAK